MKRDVAVAGKITVAMGLAAVGFASLMLGSRLAKSVPPGVVVECRSYRSRGPHLQVTLSTGERVHLGHHDIERADRCTVEMFRLEKKRGSYDFLINDAPFEWRLGPEFRNVAFVGAGLVVTGMAMVLYDRRRRQARR